MVLLTVIVVFPIGSLLLSPLETRYKTNPELPDSIEGIIVLGGTMKPILSSFWNQIETAESSEREFYFIYLAKKYPNAKLVYSGGSGSLLHQDKKEADVARSFFVKSGVKISRIIFEGNARNTYENVKFSLDKTKPELKKPWILITSAYHMPRAVGTFCEQGWAVFPYPVDHYTRPGKNLKIEFSLDGHIKDIELAIHEWLGLFVYYITGKTSSFFPGKCAK